MTVNGRRWARSIVSAVAGGLLAFALFQIAGQVVLSQVDHRYSDLWGLGFTNLTAVLALPAALITAGFSFWVSFRDH